MWAGGAVREEDKLDRAETGRVLRRTLQFAQPYPPQWKFTMHDLRRTFCTVAVNIEGMPYAVVQQLMNHSQMGNVTARYGKPTKEALRKHMQELENELLRHATTLPTLHMKA